MAYKYEMVAQGTPAQIEDIIRAEEQHIPEGGLAELKLQFRWRFPGFNTAAQEVNAQLTGRGVVPWPDEWKIVFPDPQQPVWYIRWKKGFPWAPVIVAAIVALVALLVAWFLYKVFVPVVQANPWLLPLLVLLGAGVLLLGSLAPPEERAARAREMRLWPKRRG